MIFLVPGPYPKLFIWVGYSKLSYLYSVLMFDMSMLILFVSVHNYFTYLLHVL